MLYYIFLATNTPIKTQKDLGINRTLPGSTYEDAAGVEVPQQSGAGNNDSRRAVVRHDALNTHSAEQCGQQVVEGPNELHRAECSESGYQPQAHQGHKRAKLIKMETGMAMQGNDGVLLGAGSHPQRRGRQWQLGHESP